MPTNAAPVVVSDVIQVLSNYRNPPDLRLRSVSQNSPAPASSVTGLVQLSLRQSAINGSLEIGSTVGGPIYPMSDSLLNGITIASDSQTIDVIAQNDVEGTVCDCGEITVPGGAWPKWPLLLLAAIPFFFIHGCDDCDISTPIPTPPPPTPTPTPEPASLLLLGTGLMAFGAGLRRRYSCSQLMAQIRATKEEA